jgi:hypothetical protein
VIHIAQMQTQGISAAKTFKQYPFIITEPVYCAALAYFSVFYKNDELFWSLLERRSRETNNDDDDPKITDIVQNILYGFDHDQIVNHPELK